MQLSVQGVFEARARIRPYLRRSPLLHYPLLSRLLGCRAYVKHEHVHPTGAFKVRGGLNLLASLEDAEKCNGVVTATRGNHGQSIALASRIFGVRCLIVVPEGNSPEKNTAMKEFGAELLVSGRDFDEAREKVEKLQEEQGLRYVHSGNEPALIHGVGTYALEIVEDLPDVEAILVPIGGGSGAAGVLTVVRALVPRVRVIGVQAANAPSVYLSWKAGKMLCTAAADTIADGLATRVPFEQTFSVIQEQIDEIVTVTEEELREAVYHFFRTTHQVAEPAAAAPLAAARKLAGELSGRKVVLIHSGCNIESRLLGEILYEFSGQEEPEARSAECGVPSS